jgi:hypothetical protein
MYKSFLLAFVFAFLILISCKKDSFISSPDAQISFSADTIFFDTVFTTTGSITQSVKIFNLNNQKLLFSSVRLMGGIQSPFKLNIDGAPGPENDNIEVDPNDSIYVFVSVNINPNASNLPFVLQDSIQVSFNGTSRYIQLQAWGQNAHFLNNQVISGNTTWTNDLPYVILGGLQIDTNAVLTIQKGCKIYMHANAPLLVDGSLAVQGEKADSTRVYFLGDRLDVPYNSYPGSWPGIYFRTTSKDNVLEFAVIRNAYQGVVAEDPSTDANPKLTLDECIVDNVYDAGIMGVQSSIQARNCLVSNCGRNIVIGYGGNYSFTHCTVASYSNEYIEHVQPVLNVSNYTFQAGNTESANLNSLFVNCIFWGNNGTVQDEVVVSKQGNTVFSVNFENCLWKIIDFPVGVDTTHMIANEDPLFDSVNNQSLYYDFHLQAGSPAIDQGINTGLLFDLDGNPRAVGFPDLGCYERQ